IPVPTKHPYEIDIRLDDPLRIKTGGRDQIVSTIINSGRMMMSLEPLKTNHIILITKLNEAYFLKNNKEDNGPSILTFTGELSEELKSLTEPPVGSTLIIDGRIITGSK